METWRPIHIARHVNTPYPPIEGQTGPQRAGIGPKRPLLGYIFTALLDAPLNDALHGHPFAQVFGPATSSSSDGQYFALGGRGEDAGDINAKYGQAPGVRFYTHISGRYGPFNVKVISAATSEAPYVVDGLLYHDSDLMPTTHHTDTGGVSEHVFALMHLLGFRFAPRIRGLKGRRLYSADAVSAYPTLEPMLSGRLDINLIRAHWDEILRLAASIRTGTVTASLIMRRLAAFPRQNGLAMALRELGRLERTLFTLDWLEDPGLRRNASHELNKGEARNSLARAVFFHRRGELEDRGREAQQHRASGLNVVLTAIALWNTAYLARAVDTLRSEGEVIPDHLLTHLSPLGWDHINLTGDYVWEAETGLEAGEFRPLRPGLFQVKAA
ncbi:MAG: Tn3 family transposase [Caulobacter sp.]|nr:Tn3 family transposase [Caulobacter sp.]